MLLLDILVVLRLDLGHNSLNLVKNALAIRQLALLTTSITFYDSLAWACTEIKIFEKVGDLRLSFFSFSFLFAAVIDLPLGLLMRLKN